MYAIRLNRHTVITLNSTLTRYLCKQFNMKKQLYSEKSYRLPKQCLHWLYCVTTLKVNVFKIRMKYVCTQTIRNTLCPMHELTLVELSNKINKLVLLTKYWYRVCCNDEYTRISVPMHILLCLCFQTSDHYTSNRLCSVCKSCNNNWWQH